MNAPSKISLGFALGVVCVAGPSWLELRDYRHQLRDARAAVARQREDIRQLQTTIAAQRDNINYFQQQLAVRPQAAPQDATTQLLNALHPGLGTAAVAVKKIANSTCSAGSELQSGPWQGLKCVEVIPQN